MRRPKRLGPLGRSHHVMAPADCETFCRALGPRLVGSLLLFTGDRALAEELAQEALARAFQHWDRVGTMAAPEAWAYRVAFNLARSSFRRRAVERRAQRGALGAGPVGFDAADPAVAVAVRAAVAAL